MMLKEVNLVLQYHLSTQKSSVCGVVCNYTLSHGSIFQFVQLLIIVL